MVLGSVGCTAVAMRRRLLPSWAGAEARLAEVVLGQSVTVVLLQLLGAAGILRRPAVVSAAVLLAASAWVLQRGCVREPAHERSTTSRLQGLLAAGSVAFVVAQWMAAVRAASRTGIQGVDALNYHLTYAAHFAQDGSVLHLQRLDNTGVATWYPLNDELVHGAGMVLLRSDALSLVLGFVSLGAVLLAVWCLAAPYGAGAPAIVGTSVLLVLVGPEYAASASTDWSSSWPLIAALALLLHAHRRDQLGLPVVVLCGLAGGLALGTKLTVLVPTVALLVVVLVLSDQRARALGAWLAAAVATGGLWYVRNIVVVGSPLPTVDLKVLPHVFNTVLEDNSFSVLHYATDLHVIRTFFVRGLDGFLGPSWPVLLALFAAGLVLPLMRGRDGVLRGAAAVGLASVAGYLLTPTGAGGPPGLPFLFVYNIRYALVGMLLGLVLLAVLAAQKGLTTALTLGFAVLLGVTVLRRASWATGWPGTALVSALGLLVLGGAAVLLLKHRPVRGAGSVLVALVLAALAVVAAAPAVERHYEARRYAGTAGPRDRLFAALAGTTGTRVGVVGYPLTYPFFGPRLENHVVYLGQRGPGHRFDDFTDCSAFRREVIAQRVRWVVVARPLGPTVPPATAWVRSDPAARAAVTTSAGTVFRLVGAMDPAGCS